LLWFGILFVTVEILAIAIIMIFSEIATWLPGVFF